jgi:hypothetical protein
MPIEHIVALLIQERDKLNRAIEALQGPLRRRGRPPKALATLKSPGESASGAKTQPIKRGKTTVWSAARKKAHIARMKAYWAKRKAKN